MVNVYIPHGFTVEHVTICSDFAQILWDFGG